MSIRVAINGFGRIGRNIVRSVFEYGRKDVEIVAINDLGTDLSIHATLMQYDTAHGYFNHKVDVVDSHMVIDGHKIRFMSEKDPRQLPWKDMGIDIVLECTGIFTSKAKASAHLDAGAKKVIISAPGGSDVDATIVYGVNHQILTKDMTVISNASCTTNCLAPIAKVLNELVGIESGLMTTVHAYTNDQVLTDVYHTDVRRARSATSSMIPTKTGAAAAVGLVLPELNGKLDGLSIRVPTINVSLVDLSFVSSKPTNKDAINQAMKNASETTLAGVLAYNDKPLVSVDFNHNRHSSIFDSTQTRVNGNLVKVFSWYDNEWGFSNRMIDTTIALYNVK